MNFKSVFLKVDGGIQRVSQLRSKGLCPFGRIIKDYDHLAAADQKEKSVPAVFLLLYGINEIENAQIEPVSSALRDVFIWPAVYILRGSSASGSKLYTEKEEGDQRRIAESNSPIPV